MNLTDIFIASIAYNHNHMVEQMRTRIATSGEGISLVRNSLTHSGGQYPTLHEVTLCEGGFYIYISDFSS